MSYVVLDDGRSGHSAPSPRVAVRRQRAFAAPCHALFAQHGWLPVYQERVAARLYAVDYCGDGGGGARDCGDVERVAVAGLTNGGWCFVRRRWKLPFKMVTKAVSTRTTGGDTTAGLPVGHPQGTQGGVSRQDGAGRAAHHRRDPGELMS